ncbi:MAG: FAD:protein FMN transferase [Microbacterium sp.]|jgi:thiamine biosynthesis lipoprotein|nr:FAD:protein FMN transferase [Microbacterium sp.]
MNAARHVAVREVMGTVASVHVIGSIPDAAFTAAAEAVFDVLHRADRVFSTYDERSDIRRIARGELAVADADPWVAEVADGCRQAEAATGGLFNAHLDGRFDPTGYVKGWATELAAREHLADLVRMPGVMAAGLDVGGDMQLFTADRSDWMWNVGIVDPADRTRVLATVPVREGAVATSGSAERGAHIIDPRTGRPATGIVSATVIAPSLTQADVWATAAVVAGPDTSIRLPGTGMTVDSTGNVHRWLAGVGLEVAPSGR